MQEKRRKYKLGNCYEGTFTLKLKKNIPDSLADLLQQLQKEDFNKKETIPAEFEEIKELINETWNEFSFEFGKIYGKKESNGEMYIDCVYEKEYLEDIKLYQIPEPEVSGLYISINIRTKKYIKDSFDTFLSFIYPYMSDDNPMYLGNIRDEDGFYRKDYFFDENQAKQNLENRIKFCDGCEMLKGVVPCSYEPICRRSYEIGKGEGKVK